MERSVTMIRVTPEGRERCQESADYSTRITEIVEFFGGKTEGIWAFGGTPYKFVSVAIYPDKIAALKARTHIEALGIVTIEGYPVFEMPDCLQAMAA